MKKLDVAVLRDRLRQTQRRDLEAKLIGGAEILVSQSGSLCFAEAFGEQRPGTPLEPGCLYRIASMTKPVTAFAFLLEVSRGRIGFNDPLKRYLPAYGEMEIGELTEDGVRAVGRNQTDILLWHLLCHVSGIGCGALGEYFFNRLPLSEKTSLERVTEAFSRIPLSYEPMTRCEYSATVSFDVLARVIELVSGEPYEAYLRKNVFGPIGMRDTTFAPSPAQRERMVCMYDVSPEGEPIEVKMPEGCVFENLSVSYTAAGAGLVSTARDYLRFAETLLSGGVTPAGEALLPPEVFARMTAPTVPNALVSPEATWGLGVVVNTMPGERLGKGAFYWSGAYGTHFFVDPANRVAAVYMRNGKNVGGAGCSTDLQFERDVSAALGD